MNRPAGTYRTTCMVVQGKSNIRCQIYSKIKTNTQSTSFNRISGNRCVSSTQSLNPITTGTIFLSLTMTQSTSRNIPFWNEVAHHPSQKGHQPIPSIDIFWSIDLFFYPDLLTSFGPLHLPIFAIISSNNLLTTIGLLLLLICTDPSISNSKDLFYRSLQIQRSPGLSRPFDIFRSSRSTALCWYIL